jgi:hypothetical protein
MNIRIQIQSPGFHLHSVLQPEALPKLIELVQTHRITDPTKLGNRPAARNPTKDPQKKSKLEAIEATDTPPVLSPATSSLMEKISHLEIASIIAATQNVTFPEKLVALSAFTLAKGANPTVRPRDIKNLLVSARQDPPANPGRDFRSAWDLGWMVRLQAREFVLTESGWQKAAELLALQ